MKKLIYLFFGLILISTVLAEIKQFEYVINLELENNTLYVYGEGIDYERVLEIEVNTTLISEFSKELSYSWYENVSCDTELNLDGINTKLSIISNNVNNISSGVNQILSDTLNYYELYSKCYADNSACIEYKQTNEGYKDRAIKCETDLDKKSKDYSLLQSQKKTLQARYDEISKNMNDCKNNRTLFLIWAIVSTIIALWLFVRYKRPKDKRGKNPHDSDSRGMESI